MAYILAFHLLVWAIATHGINESLHYYFCFNVHRENKIYRGCSQHWVLRWWCSGCTRRLIVTNCEYTATSDVGSVVVMYI